MFRHSVNYEGEYLLREYENLEKKAEILAVPDSEMRVTVMVDYNSPLLGTQHASMYHLSEFEKEISSEWVDRTIKREFDILKVESKTWEHPTDTERLIIAFEELSKFKIIALHNAGYTTRDGEDEVLEIERKLKEQKKKSAGYCFYHEQDLERAIAPNNPTLLIAFQKVDNSNDEITIAIGKKIVEVLKNNNFKVNWNESVENKIELTGFSWKKIYNNLDENILNHQRVLKLM